LPSNVKVLEQGDITLVTIVPAVRLRRRNEGGAEAAAQAAALRKLPRKHLGSDRRTGRDACGSRGCAGEE